MIININKIYKIKKNTLESRFSGLPLSPSKRSLRRSSSVCKIIIVNIKLQVSMCKLNINKII